ncbi:MAG: sigma-70 family RNA polymerase sigma factor [Cyclobacteriaceae bacterium]|nr:sigma-70 family RNA polymerase sigma factor [Cyclobacteriaceae bacterium]
MFQNRWTALSDEELMKHIQSGQERALTELYGRYSKKLVRYFHRMLWKDEAMAQDFLHDLFLKVIEKPLMFDAERRFSTWIYSAAFNMCKNAYRKQSFRETAKDNFLPAAEIFQPDVDHKDFKKVLENVLTQCEESDRNLFVLRYELDIPFAEIASILECPEGTVKSRLFYLKKKIAHKLKAYNPAIN